MKEICETISNVREERIYLYRLKYVEYFLFFGFLVEVVGVCMRCEVFVLEGNVCGIVVVIGLSMFFNIIIIYV